MGFETLSSPAEVMDGWKTCSGFLLKNANFFRFQQGCSFLKESQINLVLIFEMVCTHGLWPPIQRIPVTTRNQKKYMFTMGIGNVPL